MPEQATCKTCAGRGWIRKGLRIIECTGCLGSIRVSDLSPEQRVHGVQQ